MWCEMAGITGDPEGAMAFLQELFPQEREHLAQDKG
jgi:hypothetical protein